MLVRNEGAVLPLDRARCAASRCSGPNAATARTQGGGSATVHPDHVVSPLEGLRAALGPDVEVVHAEGARIRQGLEPLGLRDVRDPVTGEPGVRVRYVEADGTAIADEHRFSGRLGWLGEPVLARASVIEVEARLRVGQAGRYAVGVAGVGPFRLEADGAVLVDEDIPPEPGSDPFSAFLDPPERSAELDLDPDREVTLRLRHEITPGAMLASLALGIATAGRSPEEELARAVGRRRRPTSRSSSWARPTRSRARASTAATSRCPARQDELVRRVARGQPAHGRRRQRRRAGAPAVARRGRAPCS